MIAAAAQDHARKQLRERLRYLPGGGSVRMRTLRLRMLLEEMGVTCDDSAELQDVDAVLLASARGTEAVIAARLNDEERHLAYARIVARLLVGELHAPIDARMEYAGAHWQASRADREEDALVAGLAGALVTGRLGAAPRPLYDDVPKLRLAFTPRTAARSTLGGLHRWSVLWYKHSNLYRRWRARRDVSHAIERICVALDPAPA
ncbi:MAG TPA: hypothetical protein VEZ14_04625 [Dehalococcoidia bacterium]|nr:hypothetical protein [Dehalococcoidia bacterium]